MVAVDSFKHRWETIHGREDYSTKVKVWEDAAETVAHDLTGYTSFVVAAHNDDETSSTDLPTALGSASLVNGTTNELVVKLSATYTEALQESGYTTGRMDVFGVGASPGSDRTALIKGVWVLHRSVPVNF